MQPVINYRQSRRSACDRCRGFKLRCERDQVNGGTCERCLKAQVECTTSAPQPTQSFSSMRKDIYPFSRSCEDLTRGGEIFSALHRPCDSRVRKSVRSSGTYHQIEQQKLNTWIDQSGFPFIAGDGTFLSLGNKDVQLHQISYPTSSFDKWSHEPLAWADSPLHYLPIYNYQYGHEIAWDAENTSIWPDPLAMYTEFPESANTEFNPTQYDRGDIWPTSADYPQTNVSKNPGIGLQSPVEKDDSCFAPKNDLSRPSSYAHLKSLMHLNLDLLTDLESLEAISNLLGSSCILAERSDQVVSTINLPIFRIISHSDQFFDIVTTNHVFTRTHVSRESLISPKQLGSSPCEDSCPPLEGFKRIEDCFDTMPTTSSSDGSEHKILSDATSNPSGDEGLTDYNLSESLNILAAYCQLIRVYHALFNQLHQLFLMVPPDEAAGILSLPNLRFGKFHMTGDFTAKLQVLIELSFHMLGKIDHALGIPEFTKGVLGEDLIFPAQHISYNTSLSTITSTSDSLGSLRDHVVTREYVMVGQSLREIMKLLQAFVKTIAVDGDP